MPPTTPIAPAQRGRQARSRAARSMVREQAMRLFLRDGYAATTVEMIAETAGISRRTFFRYFESKEDVVTTRSEDLGARLGENYRARPASEPPVVAMRAAFQPVIAEYARDPVRTRAILRLSAETPELRGRYRDVQALWIATLASEVARRHPDEGPLHSELLSAVSLAALNVAIARWLIDGGDLARLLDETFGLLPAMLGPSAAPPG